MANPCPQPQNNIYVGARYVPIFAGTWDKSKTYEPLMIVEYQGNSYTSKTYVPANIDITNEIYWALTGNYNAQVEAYRKEVKQVIEQIDTVRTDLGDLGNVVNQNSNSIANINALIQKSPLANNSTILTVGKAGCMFSTINAAITEARKYCTYNNRVTILIMSGTYDEEIILLPNPGLDFIGIGSVYVSHESTYPNAPLFCVGKGFFQNIYFDSKTNTTTSPAYAFHYENQSAAGGGDVIFNRCVFTSQSNAAVGIGLGPNASCQFWNCDIAAFNGHAGIYCHNYPGDNVPNQNIICNGCRIMGYGSQYSILIDNAATLQGYKNSKMSLCFANCFSSNPKMRFRKDTTTYLTYVPVRNPDDVSLANNSTNTDFYGLDYHNADFFYQLIISIGNQGIGTIPIRNATKYNFTISAAVNESSADVSENTSIQAISPNSVVIACSDATVKGKTLNISMSVSAK